MKTPLWLSRLFADLSRPCAVTPLPVPPPAPPVQPPLSCFVQGIIRSLETEPDQWNRALHDRNQYQHKTSGLHVYHQLDTLFEKGPGEVDGFELTLAESAAVYAALKACVIDPAKRERDIRMDKLRAEYAATLTARKAVFEKLGCPTPPTTPSSTLDRVHQP